MVFLERRFSRVSVVPHYYGDVVRRLLFAGAILLIVAHPWYANDLRLELPFSALGAVVLVALAALTNPHNKNLIIADAIASGVGLLIFEVWALFEYESGTWLEFALRQGIAILFMVTFYFSMKTLRAMLLGKVGKRYEVGEFDTDPLAEDVLPRSLEEVLPRDDEPVNSYLRPSPKNIGSVAEESEKIANEEYEEKRRAQVAADKAREDKELDDLAAGRS